MSCASPHEQLCEDTARARQIPDLRFDLRAPSGVDRVHATVLAQSLQALDETRMDAYIRHEVESVFAEDSQGLPRSPWPPPPPPPPRLCLPAVTDCCRDDRGYDSISSNFRWLTFPGFGQVPLLLYPSWRGRLVNPCGWIDPVHETNCGECPPDIVDVETDSLTHPHRDRFRRWSTRVRLSNGREVSWFSNLDEAAVLTWTEFLTSLSISEGLTYADIFVRAVDLLLQNEDLAYWAACLIEGGYSAGAKCLRYRLLGPPDQFVIVVEVPDDPAWPPFLGSSSKKVVGTLSPRFVITVHRVPIVQYWAALTTRLTTPGDVFAAIAAVAAGVLRGVLVSCGYEQSVEAGDVAGCKRVFRISNTWLWAIYKRYGIPRTGMVCRIFGDLNSTCLVNSDYTHFFPGPGNCGGSAFLGSPFLSGVGDLYYRPAGVRLMPTPWVDPSCPQDVNPLTETPEIGDVEKFPW